MKPVVYGIKDCDTMKKAFAWLDDKLLVGFDSGQFSKTSGQLCGSGHDPGSGHAGEAGP